MRVLHLISSGGMYGAEAVILHLCTQMEQRASGQAFLAVFTDPHGPEPALVAVAKASGVCVIPILCAGAADRHALQRIRDAAHSTGCDLLHTHGYKADLYALAAFAGRSRPALVSTCHTWYDNDLALRLYGIADRWALRAFEEVVAVSEQVLHQLHMADVAEGRTTLIRNGVQIGQPASQPDRYAGDAVQGGLTVGLVGRLAPEKGVDVFLEAAALVCDAVPTAEFLIAGDGPEREELEALRDRLQLGRQVQFLGVQRDMVALYGRLDLLVSASRKEGLPMVLLEGMASGLPVVATRVGEVPGTVVDGKTGLVVNSEDPQALAGAMVRLLQSPVLREQFGQAAKERIADSYSAERMASEYLHMYRRALRRHRQIRGGTR